MSKTRYFGVLIHGERMRLRVREAAGKRVKLNDVEDGGQQYIYQAEHVVDLETGLVLKDRIRPGVDAFRNAPILQ